MSDPQRSLTHANPIPAAPDAPFRCEDCGHESVDNYCSRCGQARVSPPKTMLGLLGDFVGQYFNLEGKLWRTLWLLIRRPGGLTQEYFAGKRTRYFTPVKLYLTLSLLFFTITSFIPAHQQPVLNATVETDEELADAKRGLEEAREELAEAEDSTEKAVAEQALRLAEAKLARDSSAASLPARRKITFDLWWLPGAEDALEKLLKNIEEHDQARLEKQFRSTLLGQSPRVLFFMLPVFAAFFKIAFRKRCYYTEAFVFTLHLHSVFFIAVLLGSLISLLSTLVAFGAVGHGLVAMKRVFGEGWGATLGKAFGVFVFYSVVLGLLGSWLAYRAIVDM